VEIQVSLDPVDIEKQLRGVPYPGDGAVAVPASGEGKVGNRIEFEKERTGHLKEIGQEFVGGPFDDKRRKAVEHIEDPVALRFDDLMQRGAERIEPSLRIEGNRMEPIDLGKDRRMRGESEVDASPTVPDRLSGERLRKMAVIVQVIHLPDDIVAQAETLEHLIQPRKTAACRFGRCHALCLSRWRPLLALPS